MAKITCGGLNDLKPETHHYLLFWVKIRRPSVIDSSHMNRLVAGVREITVFRRQSCSSNAFQESRAAENSAQTRRLKVTATVFASPDWEKIWDSKGEKSRHVAAANNTHPFSCSLYRASSDIVFQCVAHVSRFKWRCCDSWTVPILNSNGSFSFFSTHYVLVNGRNTFLANSAQQCPRLKNTRNAFDLNVETTLKRMKVSSWSNDAGYKSFCVLVDGLYDYICSSSGATCQKWQMEPSTGDKLFCHDEIIKKEEAFLKITNKNIYCNK